ncbi:MAG: hypothetical protein AB7F99_08285 [Vicinamibacterales bacterium]
MLAPSICCPVCRASDVEIVSDADVLLICRCRVCRTTFALMLGPHVPANEPKDRDPA